METIILFISFFALIHTSSSVSHQPQLLRFSIKSTPFHFLRNSLRGTNLRLTVASIARERLNYTWNKVTRSYELTNGMFSPVAKILHETLNFTYEVYPSRRRGAIGVRQEDGTWDGMVGDILHGDADFAFAVGVTLERSRVVAFTSPVVVDPFSLIVAPGRLIQDWRSIFWSFSSKIWRLILLSALIISSIIYLGPKTKKKDLMVLIHVVEVVYRSLVGQPSVFIQKCNGNCAKRLILSLWLLCGVCLHTAYLSKFSNALTFPAEDMTPENLQDLIDFHFSDYRWGVAYFEGSSMYRLITESALYLHIPLFQKIQEKMEKLTPSECYRRALQEKFVCLAYDKSAKIHFSSTPELSDRYGFTPLRFRGTFGYYGSGIMARIGANFLPHFDWVTSVLVSTGMTTAFEDMNNRMLIKDRNRRIKEKGNPIGRELDPRYLRRNKYPCHVHKTRKLNTPLLTLIHLRGAFIAGAGGHIIAGLVLIGEWGLCRLLLIRSRKSVGCLYKFDSIALLIKKVSVEP